MKEYYVSYEIAQLLKKKGFYWDCDHYYKSNGEIVRTFHTEGSRHINSSVLYEHQCLAPTQAMACSWFRDKQIDILPDCSLVDRKYSFHIINRYKSGGEIIHSDEMYDKYEDAIEAALEYCLTNLI